MKCALARSFSQLARPPFMCRRYTYYTGGGAGVFCALHCRLKVVIHDLSRLYRKVSLYGTMTAFLSFFFFFVALSSLPVEACTHGGATLSLAEKRYRYSSARKCRNEFRESLERGSFSEDVFAMG